MNIISESFSKLYQFCSNMRLLYIDKYRLSYCRSGIIISGQRAYIITIIITLL